MRPAVLTVSFALALLAVGCASHKQESGTSAALAKAPSLPLKASDWPRFGYGLARSDVGPARSGIRAEDLAYLKRLSIKLDGTVDSSAIFLARVHAGSGVHDTLFVTTTYGKTEALDARSGALLWRFTPPDYGSLAGSYRVTNSSPVADPSRLYLYAAAPDGYVRKLRVSDGHVVWQRQVTLLPAREKLTSSLEIYQGHVLVTTGGYIGDAPPYQGHVVSLDAKTGRLLAVWNSLCSDRTTLIQPSSCPASDSAIWSRSGVVVDQGRLLVATGNGPFDGKRSWGDSLLLLSPSLKLLGSWTPKNAADLERLDLDLGSTAPVVLSKTLVAQGGKDGLIRVVSLARLEGSRGVKGGEVQTVKTPGQAGLFSAPLVWHRGQETWLFVGSSAGLEGFALVGARLERRWSSPHGSTSPVLAGGLLWSYDALGSLRVYAPTSGKQLAALPAGRGHWQSPIVMDGLAAVAEGNANDQATSGYLDVYLPREGG